MSDAKASAGGVPTGLYLQSRFFSATAGLWRRLGGLESAVLREDIEAQPITAPIYVTSLARAGTTIVTELLERHPRVTSHRYSDFPNVWTPYWRNDLLQKSRRERPREQERAHRDRIRVSNDSPEAVEEVLWRHFFPGWKERAGSQVLGAADRDPAFDAFYRDHLRKLLAVRGASRYLAKGNYNIARLGYIRDLFPDARFLVPLREPVPHIASLAKQHRLFIQATRADARTPRQLAMAGHYEFGPLRRQVRFDDPGEAAAIDQAWAAGREVEGWARYWAATYRHLARLLAGDESLRESVMLFRYQDLCLHSEAVIDALLAHCDLDAGEFTDPRAEYARRLSLPDYYRPDFSDQELATIERLTAGALEAVQAHCLRAA